MQALLAEGDPVMYQKQIVYDRKTGDFAYYLNGELVGYAPTYLEAETRLNRLVYDLLSKPILQPTIEPSTPTDDAYVA